MSRQWMLLSFLSKESNQRKVATWPRPFKVSAYVSSGTTRAVRYAAVEDLRQGSGALLSEPEFSELKLTESLGCLSATGDIYREIA